MSNGMLTPTGRPPLGKRPAPSAQKAADSPKRARISTTTDLRMKTDTTPESIVAEIQAAFNLFSTNPSQLPAADRADDAPRETPRAAILRSAKAGDTYTFILSHETTAERLDWILTTLREQSDGSHYLSMSSYGSEVDAEAAKNHARRVMGHVVPSVEFSNVIEDRDLPPWDLDTPSKDTFPYALGIAALLRSTNTPSTHEQMPQVLAAHVCVDAIARAARLENSLHESGPSASNRRYSEGLDRLLGTLPSFKTSSPSGKRDPAPHIKFSKLADVHSSLQSCVARWQDEIDTHVEAYNKYAHDLETYITTCKLIRQSAVIPLNAVRDADGAKRQHEVAIAEKRVNHAKSILGNLEPDNSCRDDVEAMVHRATEV